jgi:hypothetical protein
MSESLREIFVENEVNIIAIGTGKTHSCGRISVERIYQDTSDILLVSTMSNALINGIIKEICKCLKIYTDFEDLDLIENILNFEKNNSKLLKKLGVVILNTHNPLSIDDLKDAKVIVTNHAYFFPHGHDSNYNNNCYKIQEFQKESGKNLVCVFDEFDQFHKMGIETIPVNFFIGKNLVDQNRNQVYIADHAFRYCHKSYVESCSKECAADDFDTDYYYKLPYESFNKKLENNSEGIKYFSNSIGGKYDFKILILNNLIEVSESIIEYCNRRGKKVGDYYIKRFDEIVRYKINTDVFQDEGITSKFLKINDSIILITQKLEVFDEDGCSLAVLDTREDVIEFARNKLLKKDWINYYNTFSTEGKKLYITRMILRKKQFEFMGSKNHYVTATPGVLEKLGYKLKTDRQFSTPCKIKEMDIFIFPNKANCSSDMELFFRQLKEKQDMQMLAIANKKDVVEDFTTDNKENNSFSNVNPVLADVIIDTGREASEVSRDDKNVTYVYQKGNQTQGTNFSGHVMALQDCHIKIDIVERIVPTVDESIEIIDYLDAMKKSITQSALRILRGDYKYKAIVLFLDSEEEEDMAEYLSEYLKKYGVDTKMIHVKEVKNKNDREIITGSILKHVEDRHSNCNLGEVSDIYTYDNDNLYKEDGRKKYDEAEIVNAYCRYRLRFATDKDIKPLLKADFGISEKAFRQLKKRNMDKIDDKLNIL